MAATGQAALNCILDIDPAEFACHHGMKDGEPTRLCAGYIAARLAPFSFTKAALRELAEKLDAQEGPDQVRAEFDAWLAMVDPRGEKHDYVLAREYNRRSDR
jgi:hypothetical protein